MPLLAIVMYSCDIAGERTEDINVQVRYFARNDIGGIEQCLRAEPTHSYLNDTGEIVSWPFLRLLAVEDFDEPIDGAEVVGFITGCDEFGKWVRGSEV